MLQTCMIIFNFKITLQFKRNREFPGGPVVRTQCFHCCGPRVQSLIGNEDPASHTAWPKKKKKMGSGLPWWRSGWESACQCRGHGFEPWSGKIPHAAGQLGPCATTTEPARLELVLRNKRGRDSERPAHCDEEWPPLATTRESPRTETKTQHSQK